MSEDAKPCPFCGMPSNFLHVIGDDAGRAVVWCETCGAHGPTPKGVVCNPDIDEAEAIPLWNARFTAERDDAREKLRALVEAYDAANATDPSRYPAKARASYERMAQAIDAARGAL